MQPDWYPDPYAPGMLRWWDGSAWTAHAQPAPVYVPANPAADLADEQRAARRASLWLVVGVGVFAVEYVLAALLFGHVVHDLVRQVRHSIDSPGTRAHESTFLSNLGPNLLFDLIGLLVLGVQVFFMIWLYRAATIARRAGLPARRQPVWAFVGYVVPVVNFWFPYQVAADVFPPGDSDRRLAGRWWAWALAQNFASIPILVLSITSTPAAVVVALVLTVVPAMTAVTGRAMIAAAGQTHARLLAV